MTLGSGFGDPGGTPLLSIARGTDPLEIYFAKGPSHPGEVGGGGVGILLPYISHVGM